MVSDCYATYAVCTVEDSNEYRMVHYDVTIIGLLYVAPHGIHSFFLKITKCGVLQKKIDQKLVGM